MLLAEGAPDWRTALKRHEDEASQFGGIVSNPDSRKSKGWSTKNPFTVAVSDRLQPLSPTGHVCLNVKESVCLSS